LSTETACGLCPPESCGSALRLGKCNTLRAETHFPQRSNRTRTEGSISCKPQSHKHPSLSHTNTSSHTHARHVHTHARTHVRTRTHSVVLSPFLSPPHTHIHITPTPTHKPHTRVRTRTRTRTHVVQLPSLDARILSFEYITWSLQDEHRDRRQR
jgi:hypothetical protein